MQAGCLKAGGVRNKRGLIRIWRRRGVNLICRGSYQPEFYYFTHDCATHTHTNTKNNRDTTANRNVTGYCIDRFFQSNILSVILPIHKEIVLEKLNQPQMTFNYFT